MGSKPNIPIFQYSYTALRTDASEIFLSSLQNSLFINGTKEERAERSRRR